MKDYNKGINTYPYLKDLLAKEPNNIEANLKMADKEMALGQLDDAKAHLNNIIKQDPTNAAGKTDDAKYRLASLADKSTIAKELEAFINENPNSDVLKDAYVSLAETYTYALEDKINGEKYYAKSLELFPNDDGVKSSYGQYLNGAALNLADKGTGESDYKKGLEVVNTALTYVAGSVNEASSYYIQSKLYFNLKEYTKANESIDKALKIFDRKLYREQKDKIEKQMSLK
jgi:tetratricopeptide (TPR) repeat protein